MNLFINLTEHPLFLTPKFVIWIWKKGAVSRQLLWTVSDILRYKLQKKTKSRTVILV